MTGFGEIAGSGMRHHPSMTTLQDYLDRSLALREATSVDRHVASCAECQQQLMRLQHVRTSAEVLAKRVEPPTAVWEGVLTRISGGERRQDAVGVLDASHRGHNDVAARDTGPRDVAQVSLTHDARRARTAGSRWYRWAAAAVLLIGGAATAYIANGRQRMRAPLASAAPYVERAALDTALNTVLVQSTRPDLVSGEARITMRDDLLALKRAVTDAEAAHAAHPENVHLETILSHARRQEAEYVQRARDILADM